MRNVIIDSSSAILLYKCGLIPSLLKQCVPVISGTVFAELTVTGYDGADFFTELCGSGKIKVFTPDAEGSGRFSGSIHAGEREVIALYYEGKGEYVIIDDGRGSAYCRDNNIPYINALLAVKVLFLKNYITETEFAAGWEWLLANGRYSAKVRAWAEEATRERFGFFL